MLRKSGLNEAKNPVIIHDYEDDDKNSRDRRLESHPGSAERLSHSRLARRLVKFRADSETRARVEVLATKCNEGELTPAERHEYDAYLRAINLISILQSKARMILAKSRKPR